MKITRAAHHRNNLESSRKRAGAIEEKRMAISGLEGMIQTWEETDPANDCLPRLRHKLRCRRNELAAMGID